MSIQKIIQESIAGNPVEMKEAFQKELRSRLAEAISEKIKNFQTEESELKEEVEQIDELSKSTLASYIKKAGGTSTDSAAAHMANYGAYGSSKSYKKGMNRGKGVVKAVDKLTKEEVQLDEAGPVVTHKWYSVKHWEDGSDHYDNLDDHLHGHEYKHAALGNTSRKRPDHHIGIPVKAKSAIAYMDKHAKPVE